MINTTNLLNSIYLSCLLMLAGILTACNDDPEIAHLPVAGPVEEEPAECGRAVLVYMLADNSLGTDGYDRSNLQEMIDACRDGLLGNNRLIVYHDDRKAEFPMLKEVTPLGLKILKVYDNATTSVDHSRMDQVIADFKEVAPAKRYGLIFWSHATGWPFANFWNGADSASPSWIGEDKGKHMDVSDLASSLEGKDFDYIYFDCCHMASVEALYELRHTADYFVASAAELPAEGMPYYAALPYLMADEPLLTEAANATFSKYNGLTGSARTATMSVIDAARLDHLADATRALYALHPSLPASYSGQPFERPKHNGEPCYLFDFEDYIKNLTFNSDQAQLLNEWKEALQAAVVYEASTPWIFNSIKVDAHCGLTTYILRSPQDANNKNYSRLMWFQDVATNLYD